MKRSIALVVQGREKQWAFTVRADPRHLEEWRADGLEVSLCHGDVPAWAVRLGLLRGWLHVQDLIARMGRP